MMQFNSILYVSEPSDDQDSAVARAVSLAENNQAALTIMDVLPPVSGGIGLPPGGPISAGLKDALAAERHRALESLTAPYRKRLEIRLELAEGVHFLEVIRAVLRAGHDLVIKPAENPQWLERLFGSDDMHLLRKCPCPVWLMKPGEKANYGTIVAAVDFDFSESGKVGEGINRQILDLSCSLALSDFASLHLIHVWDAPGETLLRTWSANPDEAIREYVEHERSRHRNAFELLHQALRGRMDREAYDYLSPVFHLVQGPANRLIPEMAAQLHADLVVMGTVGRTGLPGFIIGNTAETILDQLQCSVLAVKPPGFRTPVTLGQD